MIGEREVRERDTERGRGSDSDGYLEIGERYPGNIKTKIYSMQFFLGGENSFQLIVKAKHFFQVPPVPAVPTIIAPAWNHADILY